MLTLRFQGPQYFRCWLGEFAQSDVRLSAATSQWYQFPSSPNSYFSTHLCEFPHKCSSLRNDSRRVPSYLDRNRERRSDECRTCEGGAGSFFSRLEYRSLSGRSMGSQMVHSWRTRRQHTAFMITFALGKPVSMVWSASKRCTSSQKPHSSISLIFRKQPPRQRLEIVRILIATNPCLRLSTEPYVATRR